MTDTPRKATDILVSIEETLGMLVKTIAANDMNNKLILDRLNKLVVSNQHQAPTNNASPKEIITFQAPIEPLDVSKEPIKSRRQVAEPIDNGSVKKQKIPVGQKITDVNGKDVFSADVIITNLSNGEINKIRTNVVGKWQCQLPFGKYSIKISKLIETDPPVYSELLQEIEVKEGMKSLQLPVSIIKRVMK